MRMNRRGSSRSHPTVGEVYESVRRQFPTIGLATVYNTLRTMTERGLVSELPFWFSFQLMPGAVRVGADRSDA